MKKLILLALAFVMCRCSNQHVTDYGIVEGIEINNGMYISQGKYIITISDDFNAHWKFKVYLYTDKLYKVGDTIQITKKKGTMTRNREIELKAEQNTTNQKLHAR